MFKKLLFSLLAMLIALTSVSTVHAQIPYPEDPTPAPWFIVINENGYTSIRWLGAIRDNVDEFDESDTGGPYHYPRLWSYGVWIEPSQVMSGQRIVVPHEPMLVAMNDGSSEIMVPKYFVNDEYNVLKNTYPLQLRVYSVRPCASWTSEKRECTYDMVYYIVLTKLSETTWHVSVRRAWQIEIRSVPTSLNHFNFELLVENGGWTVYGQKKSQK